MENIVVKKFGGTSVGSIERIEQVAERIVKAKASGESPVIVCSAMSGETNRLVDLAQKIDPDYRGPAYDLLLSSGEQVSISLLAMALEKRGLSAKAYLAHQLGIYTDSMYSKARIERIETDELIKNLKNGVIPIVAGFQGKDRFDNITTLGRGGSDTTAVALAAALEHAVCEIYTDVSHVYSADPRLVTNAKPIPYISFEEMVEMASLGSKVLHIRCVEIAAKNNVPIHVRSSFDHNIGTWVRNEGDMMEKPSVTSVTHEESTNVIKIFPMPDGPAILAKLFSTLAEAGIVIDIITQSHNEEGQRLAFSLPNEDVTKAKQIVTQILPEISDLEVMSDVSKISIVGVGMRNHPGVAAKFFQVLADQAIPVHIVTTSEIKVSAIIDKRHLKTAANSLHTSFGLDQ